MTEAQGSGDCFITAFRVAQEFTEEERPGVRVCHGRPVYQGDDHPGTDDGRFWHAWVEWGYSDSTMFVVDLSNGKDIRVPRGLYYAIGKLNDEFVLRYTMGDAEWSAVCHQHAGPWWDDNYPPIEA